MRVIQIMFTFLLCGANYLDYNCILALSTNQNTGCGMEYKVILEQLNHTEASSKCEEQGFDGLAVLFDHEQKTMADSIIKHTASRLMSLVQTWVGLEYCAPIRNNWKWRRNGAWLNLTFMFSFLWTNGHPDSSKWGCSILQYSPHDYYIRFKSVSCGNHYYQLCQRYNSVSDTSSRSTELKIYLKNKEKPDISIAGSSRIIPVKSLIQCSLLCLQDCQCRFIYYHSYNCYIITGSDVINTIGAGSGNYYIKTASTSYDYEKWAA